MNSTEKSHFNRISYFHLRKRCHKAHQKNSEPPHAALIQIACYSKKYPSILLTNGRLCFCRGRAKKALPLRAWHGLICALRVVGYPSGQRGQTVNLLAYAFDGSNPSPTTIFTFAIGDLKQKLPRAAKFAGVRVSSPSQFTEMSICFGLASSAFGSVTVSTPSLYCALILSAATGAGSVRARWNFP